MNGTSSFSPFPGMQANQAPLTPAAIDKWRQRIRAETFANYQHEMGWAIAGMRIDGTCRPGDRLSDQDTDVALGYFRRALGFLPESARSHVALVTLLQARGRDDEAAAAHAAALAADPAYRERAAVEWAEELLDQHRFDPAIRTLASVDPPPALAARFALTRGRALLGLKRIEEADACFHAAATGDHGNLPELLTGLRQTGIFLRDMVSTRDPDALTAATRTLGLALALNAADADAWAEIGLTAMMSGNVKEGLWRCQRALSIHPTLVPGLRSLGYAYLTQGHYRQAEDTFRRFRHAVTGTPDEVVALCTIGLAEQAQGRFDAAMAHFNAAVQRKPDFPFALTCQGLGWLGLGQPERALGPLEAAADQRRAASILIRGNLALGLQSLGRWDEALAEYRAQRRLGPLTAIHYFESQRPWSAAAAQEAHRRLAATPA